MGPLIAIPAFDEAATIGAVVTGARAFGPVLVVDDGSTDGTAERARAAGATVVSHPRRRGKSAALATAVARARAWSATTLVTLDADGQHDPRDIARLLEAGSPRTIVIGSRVDASSTGLPHGRGLAIHLAGFWLNWIAGTAVADTQSGFRVYPLALFADLPVRGRRFVFETAVLVDALARGWRIREVPVRVVPYAARPSRFHPLIDGVAIGTYLGVGALRRWRVELGAGARAAAEVFSRDRRTARHARMLAKASRHAGSPSWGVAIGLATVDEIHGRLAGWASTPRWRRARRTAVATLATPGLLAVAAVTAIAGRTPPGMDRVVRGVYDQRALPALDDLTAPRQADTDQGWIPTTSS